MRVFDKLAYLFLERLLKAVETGGRPDISAWLHKLLASGPDPFKRALRELIKARSWETCKPLLRLLIDTSVGEWIPAELMPRFTFIDLEHDPKSNIIREFAIATVHPLVDFPEIDELLSEGGRSIDAEEINGLLNKHSLGVWIVGHNIPEFDAIKLREIGVTLGDDNLLDTLELSLILDPLKSRHALDGEHRAREDVLKNISLFWSFDRRWLALPRKDVEKHLSWQDHASGLGRYLNAAL